MRFVTVGNKMIRVDEIITQPKRKVSKYAKGSNQYQKRKKVEVSHTRPAIALMALAGFSGLIIHSIPNDDKSLTVARTAEAVETAAQPQAEIQVVYKERMDQRGEKLGLFLKENNSPLTPYADHIVKEADRLDIPWTLVAAISGKESTFGKHIKPGSHNAWGIMAWDSNKKRYIRSFNSWEEGITFVSELLAKHYRENMNRGIQEKYCPSFECSTTWVDDVTSFQKEINNGSN